MGYEADSAERAPAPMHLPMRIAPQQLWGLPIGSVVLSESKPGKAAAAPLIKSEHGWKKFANDAYPRPTDMLVTWADSWLLLYTPDAVVHDGQ